MLLEPPKAAWPAPSGGSPSPAKAAPVRPQSYLAAMTESNEDEVLHLHSNSSGMEGCPALQSEKSSSDPS